MSSSGTHGQDGKDVPADLLHLEDFNDSELLRGLWARYEKREIYTWVGSVLVSVNPYSDVGAFKEEMAARYGSDKPPQAPHLFAVVRQALTSPGSRHALLITGESGAGKTEATRAVLSFLAMRHTATDYIRDRLLRSTPVLEAFGNAHTRQNANSSRFGKFIEVHLSAESEVIGATLQPYMLEASRVAGNLVTGERTYHVFYLLRAALRALANQEVPSGPFWARLAVDKEWAELVKTGGSLMGSSKRLSNGPEDARCLEWFEALVEGLLATGMRNIEVAECCRIVAAVALLSDPELGEEALTGASTLLRLEEKEIRSFLTRVEMSVGPHERCFRERSKSEAATLRASLAQELYAALFAWLTRLVARGIAPRKAEGGRVLGLLDLYGFEVFSTNGFEQFLINYCNERLQQFFNRQVFQCEAEEYAAEGLDCDGQWNRLTAACQLPALALLEGQGSVGIFGVINDRSKCNFEEMSTGSASTALAETISGSCGSHPAFCRASGRDASRLFGVKHFAGEVFYQAEHFVRKNASAHRPDIVSFLREHGGSFVREVLAGEAEESKDAEEAKSGRRGRKLFGRTLINILQQELNELCTTLEARHCRHIRCLRPNDEQKPLVFDDVSMLRQCRYSGLLEATRIRKQGYAHRRPLTTFAGRYAILLGSMQARRAARSAQADTALDACKAIGEVVASSGISPEDFRIGRTKVFLREAALTWLDATRSHVAIVLVSAAMKGNHQRRRFLKQRQSAVALQAFARGSAGRRQAERRRQEVINERRAAARRMAEERAAEERRIAEEAERAAAEAAARAMACIMEDAAMQLQRTWRNRQARIAACAARQCKRAQLGREAQEYGEGAFEKKRPLQHRLEGHRQPSVKQLPAPVARGPVIVTGAPYDEDMSRAVISPTALLRCPTPSKRHIGPAHKCTPTILQCTTRPLEPHELLETSHRKKRADSPRSQHRLCHQECIQLLAHHQRLQSPLPEQTALLAELVKTTDFLSSNTPAAAKEHLPAVKERIEQIKASLNASIATSSAAPVTRGSFGAEQAVRDVQRHPSYNRMTRACSPGNPASASIMALADRRTDLPRSSSALLVRSHGSVQSPRTSGFRSPVRTPSGSARSVSSQGGYQTPMRASAGSGAPPPSVGGALFQSSVLSGLNSAGGVVVEARPHTPMQRQSLSFIPPATTMATPLRQEPVAAPQWAWQPHVGSASSAPMAVPVAASSLPVAAVAAKKGSADEVVMRCIATPSRMRSPIKVQNAPVAAQMSTPSRRQTNNSHLPTPVMATSPQLVGTSSLLEARVRAPSAGPATTRSTVPGTPQRVWPQGSRLQSVSPCRLNAGQRVPSPRRAL